MILNVMGNNTELEFSPEILVIAGFTGRDKSAAEAHVRELADLGIEVPDEIPAFYRVDASLATQENSIVVSSNESSGEAEPVLITTGGRRYVAVGSDHTARDVEKTSIAKSKGACSKPFSREVFELDFVKKNWGNLVLKCYVERDGRMVPYQDGPVANLTPAEDLMEKLNAKNPGLDMSESIMFLGTVPLLTGDFVYGKKYRVELIETSSGSKLVHEYTVDRENERSLQ